MSKTLEKGDVLLCVPGYRMNYASVRVFEITRVTPSYAYGICFKDEIAIQRTATGSGYKSKGADYVFQILTPEIQRIIEKDIFDQKVSLWFSDFKNKATQEQKKHIYNIFNDQK